MTLSQGFQGMYMTVAAYVFFSNRTAALSVVTAATGALNVALALALVGPLGMKGVALAYVLAAGARAVLTWLVAARRHPMPWLPGRAAEREKT